MSVAREFLFSFNRFMSARSNQMRGFSILSHVSDHVDSKTSVLTSKLFISSTESVP